MKYTWDDIHKFIRIYYTDEFGDRDKFIEKMILYGVAEEESCLMWQCFDMAIELENIVNNYKYD